MSVHILIVEDEPELAETLAYNLQKEGFEVSICHTGTAALREIERSSNLSLVLLDLMLPDMSGIEVCRQIRQSSQNGHLAVIMVTARSEEIDRVIGFEAGADDYVVKPFSARELVLRIHAVLRRGHIKKQSKFVSLCHHSSLIEQRIAFGWMMRSLSLPHWNFGY